jgi:hypothetical protein
MSKTTPDGSYSDAEAAHRRDITIRRMIATPPKPHAPLKKRNQKKHTTEKRKSQRR